MPFKILFYLVRISDRIINPFEWAPHFKIYYISGVYAKQVAPLKLPDALLKKRTTVQDLCRMQAIGIWSRKRRATVPAHGSSVPAQQSERNFNPRI